MEKIVEELQKQQNIRVNLSNLRQLIKDEKSCRKLAQIVEADDAMWIGFLGNEDAKTRKNIALLLGDISYQPAAEALWDGYNREQTLFVKSSYLEALGKLDVEDKLPQFSARVKELEQTPVSEENRKHVEEELRALRKIIIRYEGISRHTFSMKGKREVILVTNRIHREVVRRGIPDMETRIHPLGVSAICDSMEQLEKLRTYREILFPLEGQAFVEPDPREAAESVLEAGLLDLLRELHEGDGAYYFRVECRSDMTLSERSAFCKKFAAWLERSSGGALVNSTTDYEIEIRLVANKEGKLFPCVKCFTLKDRRFTYRKNAISASIHPATAALIMELARPFLKENAQVMDPFCGVGTMLIERTKAVQAGDMYATDIFGDAIEMGRENAALAGVSINFIHRDFFDFTHDYLFDEMITNMPVRGKKSKEEMEELYSDFFRKAPELLKDNGVVIMYTNEIGFVKKQLRLHKEFTLLQETLMQSKGQFYLMILGVKG